MARRLLLGSSVLCVALLVTPGFSQTVTLEAIGDTYLRSGSPNQNQGSEAVLKIRASGNNRSLVIFDQSEIESAVGTNILVSAALELWVESAGSWGGSGRTVDAHRLSEAWTELGAT